jgi:hypothetical protein
MWWYKSLTPGPLLAEEGALLHKVSLLTIQKALNFNEKLRAFYL